MTSQAGTVRPAWRLAGTELAGTGILTRLALRRDRIMIASWVYVLAAFAYVSVVSHEKALSNGRVQAGVRERGGHRSGHLGRSTAAGDLQTLAGWPPGN